MHLETATGQCAHRCTVLFSEPCSVSCMAEYMPIPNVLISSRYARFFGSGCTRLCPTVPTRTVRIQESRFLHALNRSLPSSTRATYDTGTLLCSAAARRQIGRSGQAGGSSHETRPSISCSGVVPASQDFPWLQLAASDLLDWVSGAVGVGLHLLASQLVTESTSLVRGFTATWVTSP